MITLVSHQSNLYCCASRVQSKFLGVHRLLQEYVHTYRYSSATSTSRQSRVLIMSARLLFAACSHPSTLLYLSLSLSSLPMPPVCDRIDWLLCQGYQTYWCFPYPRGCARLRQAVGGLKLTCVGPFICPLVCCTAVDTGARYRTWFSSSIPGGKGRVTRLPLVYQRGAKQHGHQRAGGGTEAQEGERRSVGVRQIV